MTLVATTDPATGTIRIDVEQTIALDNFTRVVAAGGWGNATPTAQPWTVWDGVAANFSVNGTRGLITLPSNGQGNGAQLSTGGPDMYLTGFFEIPVNGGVGTTIVVSLVGRFTDSNNYYFARIFLAGGGAPAALVLGKQVVGVGVDLATVGLGVAHFAGLPWFIDLSICGNQIKATAWPSGQPRPGWLISVTDGDLTSGNGAGVWDIALGGAPTPFTIQHDNFHAAVSQPIRLFRVTPDGVETEVRGSPGFTEEIIPVSTATSFATFWDNEAPLNTDVFYVLKSNCNTAVRITSNTVNLDSAGDGWLRDPTNPSNNIRIAFADTQFNQCDSTNRVVLTDWEPRTYRNASGQFDTINAQRVVNVGMTRKRYDSSMTFASKTLTDVDDLESLIAPGSVLLLSLPPAYGFGRPYGSDYIAVQDVNQLPVDTDDYQTPFREWEVPFSLSYPPVDTNEGMTGGNGIGGGGATYADLAASALGTTYATLAASGQTYQQVAQGVGY